MNKWPISEDLFRRIVRHIVTQLDLGDQDHLVDLCCCNGLFTHEFAKHAHHATGIDFVPRNFETAKKWKALHNTTYLLGDVTAPLE